MGVGRSVWIIISRFAFGNNSMKNKYLKIILKPIKERNIGELLAMIRFYKKCSPQEFRYAMGLEYHLYKFNK